MLTQAPRGTKDILPDSVERWRYVEEKIRDICERFGYREIRTPLFEHTELFQRGIGDTTDVVEKEMYTFTDRGGRSITLRPENTAAAVRAYLEHKLYAEDALTKLFYIGSMFRFDRPQKGRFREFHQFGVEALGEASPAVDAEIILLAVRFLQSLGLKELSLSINSVGDPACRPVYRQKLKDFFKEKLDGLCEDCRSRYDRNPMRILDCKNERCQSLSIGAPEITDCLCDECAEHFEKVKSYLTAAGVRLLHENRLRDQVRAAGRSERRGGRRTLRWIGGRDWRRADAGGGICRRAGARDAGYGNAELVPREGGGRRRICRRSGR